MPKKPNRLKLRTLDSTTRRLGTLQPALPSPQPKDTRERWHSDAAYRKRSKFYSSKRWADTRAAVLRNNPFCAWCLMDGRLTRATVVDHIVDLADGGAECDYANLRALCAPCHNKLTRMKQNGEPVPDIPACTPPKFNIA